MDRSEGALISVRFIDPAPRQFDNNGLPLDFGLVYSYRQYTNAPLASYADNAGTDLNPNPVQLTQYGITPNIFLDGNYGFRLTDKHGVQLWSRDHIATTPEQFSDWSPTLSYRIGDIVTASDGNYYQSTTDNNINNDPLSSPSSWSRIRLFEADDAEIARLETISAMNAGQQDLLVGDGSQWGAMKLAPIARDYLAGLQVNLPAGGIVSVSPGACADSGNGQVLYLDAPIEKAPLQPFEVGDGNGGLATGALTNVDHLGLFLVRIGNVVDVMLDSDFTCANGRANNAVTHYRRIAYIPKDNPGGVAGVRQHGDFFILDGGPSITNRPNPGTSAVLVPTNIPPNCQGIFSFTLATNSNNAAQLLVSNPHGIDIAPSPSSFTIRALPNASGQYSFYQYTVVERVDEDGNIRYRLSYSDADITAQAVGFGWVDDRDRNAK